MDAIRNKWRFWLPVLALAAFAVHVAQTLARAHTADVKEPKYGFTRELAALRGTIYDSSLDASTQRNSPLAKSGGCWEFRLDPVAMTGSTARISRNRPPRTREAMARTISHFLKLDYDKVLAMAQNTAKRYQFLAVSDDRRAYETLTDRRIVAGVRAIETDRRKYYEENRLAHVLGGIDAKGDGVGGIEQRFNRALKGTSGRIKGMRDAARREIVEKREVSIPPVRGADVYLTVNRHLQYEAETALADGLREYGADSGWCVVLDARTAEVLAMATLPGFDPSRPGRYDESLKQNKAIAFTYEPGSVMKTITACAALDTGLANPSTTYSTDRLEKDANGEFKYYKLPGDGSHVWEARMTLKDAIVHSSNIVMGKVGWELGSRTLYEYMMRFGFGEKSGIELPGEETGIVHRPENWDLATRSRAAIGQGVSVTALQLAGAYQAIANDGVRIEPRIVRKVTDADGKELLAALAKPARAVRVTSAATARQAREMMLGVATREGTARRAAIPGYSVAGKTGTAQKVKGKSYAPGLYRATFCGIVPSGTESTAASAPRIVALVTYDFEERRQFHQGGNSAAPVFKRIASAAMRILEVPPDRPDELMETDAEQ